MKFELKVNMENQSFEENPILELQIILNQVWTELENHSCGKVWDSNGNTVGKFEIFAD